MDCNKEEAIQVLDLAEKKFKSKDIEGALKFALKAQRLFPSLGNLKQTIAAYEVHMAAAKTDWHAVLHVDPSSDLNAIKKQFKNMCLLTHPDKNRQSSAPDGAFKMVMKAWSILSSTTKSTSSTFKPKKKPDQDTESSSWEYLYAKIRCDKCNLLRFWDFSRKDHKSFYHYCKRCSTWCVIRTRLAKANVPLTCQGCDCNLSWGLHRPFGYKCRNCDSYYVVGVDPNWIPKSQSRAGESSYQPETVSCPYCGTWNKYEADDCNRTFVRCTYCGLSSVIELDVDSSM